MRFVVRWAFRLVILLVVLITALLLLKDTLLTEFAQMRLRSATGLEVSLAKCHVGLLSPTLTLAGLKIYNPPEFGGATFLDMPELHLEYDRDALAARRLRFQLVRLDVAEVGLVRDRTGRSNLEVIQGRLKGKVAGTGGLDFTFAGIDTLNLTLGKLTQVDLRQPGPPRVIDLGVHDAVFTGLKTESDLYLALGQLVLKQQLHWFTSPPAKPPPKAR